jgi:hypothetical protein
VLIVAIGTQVMHDREMVRSKLTTFLLVVTMTTLGSFLAQAADLSGAPWTLLDDDEGIRVFEREIPGQELPGFRGEAVIAAPLERIVAELKDYAHHTEWMESCVASYKVKDLGNGRVIDYNRTEAPWPVWDRDVILDSQWTTSADGKLVSVTFVNTDPTLKPLPEKTVRMPRLSGFYRLWKLEPEKTKVVYQVEADPGGSIPTWLAKRVARDLPFKTLAVLRERVTKAR